MPQVRLGVITDTSPLSVALGGSDTPYTNVKAVAGAGLAVDDVVSVIRFGADLLILGRLGEGIESGRAVGCFSAGHTTTCHPNNSTVKVPYVTEDWDVSGWYDAADSKYVPQIAGYYRLSAALRSGTSLAGGTLVHLGLYKNGSIWKWRYGEVMEGQAGVAGTWLVEANGSTDYFEIYVSTTADMTSSADATTGYFQGEFIGT